MVYVCDCDCDGNVSVVVKWSVLKGSLNDHVCQQLDGSFIWVDLDLDIYNTPMTMNGNASNGVDYKVLFRENFKATVDKLYKEQEDELAALLDKEKHKDEEERTISR